MTLRQQRITPFLWFDHEAEDAAKFYVSVFRDSSLGKVVRYGEAGPGPAGSVMTVGFRIEGQEFTALNGGPQFKFTEAVSFVVHCKTQREVDYYWDALLAGGGAVQACGWLKDRFGLCWQVVPEVLLDLVTGSDGAKAQRVMGAMLQMKKLDIAALERAGAG